MKYKHILLPLTIILLLNACATFKPQFKDENHHEAKFPNKEIDRTFFLIGDAGKSPLNGMSTGLRIFENHIKERDTKDDFVLFLGDNIYPDGLPDENQSGRAEAENNLKAQINAVQGFKGKTIFIPGNHDWYADGVEGVKRQEKYIEDALGDDTFLPENGCPLKSIEVSDDIQLIVLDTQWYLENWNSHPTINDECEIKTRERLFEEIEGELKKSQNKTIVFALHHPLYTNGSHGGYFAANKHLYPTQKKLPMPVLASLAAQIRTQGGVSIQDRFNESYNELMNRIETLTFDTENLIFVSGHEHTLQYIETKHVKQIVSGSASKASFAALGENGLFSYGKEGFAELTVFKDRSSWVKFYGTEDGFPKLIYQKEVYPTPIPRIDLDTIPDTFPKEVEVSIYSKEETDKTDFFESVWGNHYRDVYSTKIKAKVATLDTLYGGLEVVRKGGGHQTRSLRLKTKDGRELNMRALRKSATQYLQAVLFKDTYIQDDFEKTLVEDLILDFYTAAHPYAFMVVPDLSDAAKLYHTNPKLFYIPKHRFLGEYNLEFGDELYMIEERPEENYSEERNFGYADDIESTHDIIEKIREDEKYKIDENAYIRARLFDMLIGDWDRHEDQWRWARFDMENGDSYFRPIPRDRDQVFSNFDGALLGVMRIVSGSTKQLQVYDEELADIEWMNAAGIKLDRVLIQRSGLDTWLEHADFLMKNVTDEVIEKAFTKVPEEVQDSTLKEIKQTLKGRRANLKDIAQRYYNYFNKQVILAGTDKDDYIEIFRKNNEETHVTISRIIDGEKAEVIVDRTFNKDETKEMWIYGLDDKDIIEVHGPARNPIFMRIIGGQEDDTYIIKNGNKLKLYDHESKPNTIKENKGARVKLTDIYNLNLFDFQKNITKSGVMTPSIGYNPDDGFTLGFQKLSTLNGFQRNPFSQEHRLKAVYSFGTKGAFFEYQGEFANIMEDWNFHLAAKITNGNFTRNFFGYGNETFNNAEDDYDYNRVKNSIYHVEAGILRKPAFGSDYVLRTIVQAVDIDETNDRFIDNFAQFESNDFFDRNFFIGLDAEYNYKSADKAINPTRGMTFKLAAGVKTNVKKTEGTYGYINSDIGFYNALIRNRKLVLKTDLRTQFRIREGFQFYQAATIGGNNGLRGYRNERFTSKNAVVGSADLRYSFNSFKTKTLPLQIGVFAGADAGKVWGFNEETDKWHNDYGGGFWITAAESISGTFNFFNSVEGLRFSFGLGLNFN